jgi:hypothetical protein
MDVSIVTMWTRFDGPCGDRKDVKTKKELALRCASPEDAS